MIGKLKQFSVRALLVLVFIFAAAFAWLGAELRSINPDRMQELEVASLVEGSGGRVRWSSPHLASRVLVSEARMQWLSDVIIYADRDPGGARSVNELLRKVSSLKRLESLDMDLGGRIKRFDESMKVPASVRVLSISSRDMPSDAFANYLSQADHLVTLGITSNKEFDARCIAKLRLPKLRALFLSGTALSDDLGMREVGGMNSIKELGLIRCDVSDRSLPILLEMKLEKLHVRYSQLTPAAIAELRASGVDVTE